ncbi:MAG: glycogen-binding domain-containing protein [Gemmatimonadaceae bacterium]
MAGAQRIESSIDLGGVAIQYADTLNGVAASVSPQLFADWGNKIAEAGTTYSQFGSDWSLQGHASGSVFVPVSRFGGELAGFAGGSTHRDGSRTGELLLNARLHAEHRLVEWFIGAGIGRTTFGSQARDVLLGEAGVSRNIQRATATLTITPVAMGDSVRYADAQLLLSGERKKVDFSALVGGRVGDQLTALGGTTRIWGNASITSWLTSRAAVVLSGGTYPIDPTQGFPGGRFISLGVRLAHPPRLTRQANSDSAEVLEAKVVAFETENRSGVVTFKVLAPLAKNVEVAGDFTDWDPLQMAPAGNGWWIASRALRPGKYQIDLRMNGGKWTAPPGLLSMLDEFGGSVGLLVVE